jgi:hypothetical protein
MFFRCILYFHSHYPQVHHLLIPHFGYYYHIHCQHAHRYNFNKAPMYFKEQRVYPLVTYMVNSVLTIDYLIFGSTQIGNFPA